MTLYICALRNPDIGGGLKAELFYTDPAQADRFVERWNCSGTGIYDCVGRLRDGLLVAIAKTIAAFEEDCRRAALVVSVGDAPPGCGTLVVDRQVWRRSGAMALRRTGEGFEITAARPAGYERPWTRTVSAAGSEAPPASRPTSSAPRDATPRGDDLEAGD